ncbi:MAG: hypothetical protein KUG50_02780 [Cycloclasticus sp.]|nr:hypothetical protein [Cycloclasticus sp.]
MKDISIRRNILKLLLLFGVTQFQCIAVATEKEKLISTKEEGAASLAHMKSNQSLANDQSSTLKSRDSVFGITRLTSESHLLVGNKGLLVRTLRGLESEKFNAHTKRDLLSVRKVQSGHILLGGVEGALFLSNGDVNKWSTVSIDTNESIFNIVELPTREVFLSGGYGLLMYSKPPYQKWEPVKLPWADFLKDAWQELGEADPHLYSACHNQRGDLLIVGEFGLVIRRDNTGKWRKIHGGAIQPAIYDCDISDTGEEIVLVGQKGLVYQTDNGGLSWLELDIAKGEGLYKVDRIRDLSIILGDKKKVYVSAKPSEWQCQRFTGDKPLGWFIDMSINENEVAVIGSNGGFKVMKYSSLLSAVNQLDNSKEFVSCE